MRVQIPEGEHPAVWTTRKLGSPELLRSRNDAFDTAYFNDSSLTPREREMVRMRFVHHADCNLCVQTRAARDMPGYANSDIPEEHYEHVLEHRTWPGYTERERLVIEFAERYMLDYAELCYDDAFWERLGASFSETELADLCHLCGHWEASTKAFHLLGGGMEQACEVPSPTAAADAA
jgi:alkylhydroperoxidase family enzyme